MQNTPLIGQWLDNIPGIENWYASSSSGSTPSSVPSGGGSTAGPGGIDPFQGKTLLEKLQTAIQMGQQPIESTTSAARLESQFNQKANLLGIKFSGNMSNFSNPNVQAGLEKINSITSNPDRIWKGTWVTTPVIEYIKDGVGVVLNRSSGRLETILQRTPDEMKHLQDFVDNGTAEWLK